MGFNSGFKGLKIQHAYLADGGHTSPEIALHENWEN
jgi:hypothetical protein